LDFSGFELLARVRHPSGKIRQPELHRYDAHEARQVAKQGVCAPNISPSGWLSATAEFNQSWSKS